MRIFSLISFTSFLVSLFFGVIVYLQDTRSRTNLAFLLLCLTVAYFGLCEYGLRSADSYAEAQAWGRAFALWPLVVSSMVHFAVTFSDPGERRRPPVFHLAIHGPALLFCALGLFTDLIRELPVKASWGWTYGLSHNITMRLVTSTWAAGLTGYGVVKVARLVRLAPTAAARKRALMVLLGLALPVAAGLLTESLLPLLGVRIPEASTMAFAACCLIVGYGMWRHRLFKLSTELAAPTVVRAMPDALLVVDQEGRVASFNPAAVQLFGYSETQLASMEVTQLIPSLKTSKKTATISDREISIRTRTGEPIPVSLAQAPLRADTGAIEGFAVVLRDVTLRKVAELQRVQEQQFSDSLMDSLPGVFYLLDTQGRILRWNRNLEQVSGYAANEVRELLASDLVGSDDKVLLAERIGEAFVDGEASIEAELRKKDGTLVPYYFTGRRVMLQEQPFLVGMGVDISDRKRLEEELLHSQKMQAVGTLAGGIAHDFNNLLTVILGCAEKASLSVPMEDELREDLEQISIAGKSAARLTRQLLQFSRKQIMRPRVVQLQEVVEPLTSLLQRLVGEDIPLELDLDADLWPVEVDVASVEQVVVNLVVNARDAQPHGGRILVQAENRHLSQGALAQAQGAPAGPFTCLSVTDDGEGISEEVQERIFEPFYTTKDQGRGTGLGLSVVYGIVRQHDGWLQVVSTPGGGTRFEVYLPRSAVLPEAQVALPDAEDRTALQGIRVLLIEDESAVLRFASSALRRRGCEVITAAGFAEGIATFEKEPGRVDLLFSDVILPDGNGLELARRVLASHPDLPVLLTSGYTGDRSRVEEILELGLRYLQKPYRLADLYREVGAATASRQKRSTLGNHSSAG